MRDQVIQVIASMIAATSAIGGRARARSTTKAAMKTAVTTV